MPRQEADGGREDIAGFCSNLRRKDEIELTNE
jgi:hypothetical protein